VHVAEIIFFAWPYDFRSAIFSSSVCLGEATLLHEPVLKAASGQVLKERLVRQFPAVQANLHGG
jgi:hypothetical protein